MHHPPACQLTACLGALVWQAAVSGRCAWLPHIFFHTFVSGSLNFLPAKATRTASSCNVGSRSCITHTYEVYRKRLYLFGVLAGETEAGDSHPGWLYPLTPCVSRLATPSRFLSIGHKRLVPGDPPPPPRARPGQSSHTDSSLLCPRTLPVSSDRDVSRAASWHSPAVRHMLKVPRALSCPAYCSLVPQSRWCCGQKCTMVASRLLPSHYSSTEVILQLQGGRVMQCQQQGLDTAAGPAGKPYWWHSLSSRLHCHHHSGLQGSPVGRVMCNTLKVEVSPDMLSSWKHISGQLRCQVC